MDFNLKECLAWSDAGTMDVDFNLKEGEVAYLKELLKSYITLSFPMGIFLNVLKNIQSLFIQKIGLKPRT